MIEDAGGRIDYDDSGGTGPTIVLVPGSCSTGAAWRPVMANWDGQFRCITTSLLGYGQTSERRTRVRSGAFPNQRAVKVSRGDRRSDCRKITILNTVVRIARGVQATIRCAD